MSLLKAVVDESLDDSGSESMPVTVEMPRPALEGVLGEFKDRYATLYVRHSTFPTRPGKAICMKYMRSGECAGKKSCQYDHPMERFGDDESSGSIITTAQTVIKMLGNLCSLISNVTPDARFDLVSFVGDLVAVLDKYFDDLSSDYGSGSILYGDSVLQLLVAFKSFQKTCLPSRRRQAASSNQDRGDATQHDDFEVKSKILLECLKYLNTRWEDDENLLSSVLQYTLRAPSCNAVLSTLGHDISALSEHAKEQQNVNCERKTSIQAYLLGIANRVVDAYIRDKKYPESLLGTCILKPFGSSANSLGSSVSDLDLCLGYDISLSVEPCDVLQSIAKHLQDHAAPENQNQDDDFNTILVKEVVAATRVPVLKLYDSKSNLEVDVCVNNFLALKNTALLKRYCHLQPRFRALVLAVKHWAKARGCADPRNATLTSYAWTLMVANFMINHREKYLPPALEVDVSHADGNLPINEIENKSADLSVSQLFMEFFTFYGVCCTDVDRFSPFHHILSVRQQALATGKRLSKMSSMYNVNVPPPLPSNTQQNVDSMDMAPLLEKLTLDEASPNPNPGTTVRNSSLPTWRFCIEDPYEEHDLGRVIYSQSGQIHMMNEMRRVITIFQQFVSSSDCDDSITGESFWTTVCEPNPSVPQATKVCMTCGTVGHFSRDCLIEQKCHICNRPGHFARDCVNLKCRKCNQVGHFARNCTFSKVCKICHSPGHLAQSCPSRRKSNRKLYDPKTDSVNGVSLKEVNRENKIKSGDLRQSSRREINNLTTGASNPHRKGPKEDPGHGAAAHRNQSNVQRQEAATAVRAKPNKKGRVVVVVDVEDDTKASLVTPRPGGGGGRGGGKKGMGGAGSRRGKSSNKAGGNVSKESGST